jgi:hypothetical protein
MKKDKYYCLTLGCKNEVEIEEMDEKFKKHGKIKRSTHCLKCEQSTIDHLNNTKAAKVQQLLRKHHNSTYKKKKQRSPK